MALRRALSSEISAPRLLWNSLKTSCSAKMKIEPTTQVGIHPYNGEPKAIPLLTLMTWSHALKSEVQGFQVSAQRVEPIAREFLEVPDDMPLEDISEFVSAAYEDIKQQIGIEE